MIRAAVCDDERYMAGQLERLLALGAASEGVTVKTEVFLDGRELADSVRSGNSYDLIYLDIEMGETDGIRTAKEIRRWDRTVLLTYVTGHESYAKDVFEVQPFRFIVKPVQEEKFLRYFRQALEELRRGKDDFKYSSQKVLYKIAYDRILYFESKGRSVRICQIDGEGQFYGKLDQVEQELEGNNAGFIRIHKSYLVNSRYVKQISYKQVILMDGTRLPVSESRGRQIQDSLFKL